MSLSSYFFSFFPSCFLHLAYAIFFGWSYDACASRLWEESDEVPLNATAVNDSDRNAEALDGDAVVSRRGRRASGSASSSGSTKKKKQRSRSNSVSSREALAVAHAAEDSPMLASMNPSFVGYLLKYH